MASKTVNSPKATAGTPIGQTSEDGKVGHDPEKIRTLAYQKWEAAGKPACDGTHYWREAEKEITQNGRSRQKSGSSQVVIPRGLGIGLLKSLDVALFIISNLTWSYGRCVTRSIRNKDGFSIPSMA